MSKTLQDLLAERFGETLVIPEALAASPVARGIANHRTIRHYRDEPVALDLVRALCAVALSAPSKSDLQQADLVELFISKVLLPVVLQPDLEVRLIL